MSRRKPFDLEEARRQLEEIDDPKEAWKLRQKIYAEEDRLAQEYFNDPESRARDEAMKQSNREAMERWRAEHGDKACVAEPYREEN